ncbi:MAG: hypothetical protein ABR606_08880 [Vicinamibacterales bacterium]
MNLLLATAPWPVLLRIITTRRGPWTIWGHLPAAVVDFLHSEGHAALSAPLPRPFHHHALPDEVREGSWQAIVVPAPGHALPAQWNVVRHFAPLGHPVIVSDGASWQWIHHQEIPCVDAYTWAHDRLAAPPAAAREMADADLVCVGADSLSDVLLAWPALAAAAGERRVTVIARESAAPWLAAMARGGIDVRGVAIEEWVGEPAWPAANDVIALSSLDATSPLTPAIAHALPARRRAPTSAPQTYLTTSEVLADLLGISLDICPRGDASSDERVGILCPGSSPARELGAATWSELARIVGNAIGVTRWTILGATSDRAAAIAASVPHASPSPFPSDPDEVLARIDTAVVVIGVSTALCHLAAVRTRPTIVVEHPMRPSLLAQVPGDHAHYVRPSSPWWRAQPDAIDVARATAARGDSYGFWPDELVACVEEAAVRLAHSDVGRPSTVVRQ